ncbi:LOG family protein [Verrucomicrobiaceae bacterium 227]
MPFVRLSGTVLDSDDPGRTIRAKLLFLLYNSGWDISNSNGDQQITLSNIERKIVDSDAFVFTPGPSLEDMFKAISIFVGYQTLDKHLSGKPTVILNNDESWDPFFRTIARLNQLGTVKQDYRDFLLSASTPEKLIKRLQAARSTGLPDIGRIAIGDHKIIAQDTLAPEHLRGNVCVFCSATLETPSYISDGESLGRRLAKGDYGCVSGAGRSGIMGAVVRGSVQAGGWTAGSNVPHIIELEGLPEGLSSFWLRHDIYTRMEVMIENSDAFVIFPGGAGTVQELLALLIFKQQGHDLINGKPIIIFNREHEQGVGFWDTLIDLLKGICDPADFEVALSLDEIENILDRELPAAQADQGSKELFSA